MKHWFNTDRNNKFDPADIKAKNLFQIDNFLKMKNPARFGILL